MESATLTKTKTSFSIEVKKTKYLLDSVFRTINPATVLPILEDVLVKRSGGEISFSTTDLENIMSVSMPDEGDDFTCVFPGLELKYLIKNAILNDLYISLSGQNDKPDIAIRNGDFKLKLPSEPVSNYPKFMQLSSPVKFMIDVKELIPYLETALKFVSNDDLRPAMTGVCFIDWKGYLHIASTDAHRLYWHPVCKTPKGFESCSFIVSHRAAALIISAFKTEKDIIISKDSTHLQVMCEGKQFTTRLMDSRYPDFPTVIPDKHALAFYLNRSELISTLRLCSAFTNKSTRQLVVDLSSTKMNISGGDVDFSTDFSSYLLVHNPSLDTFTDFTFGMNANFLLQAAECSNDEKVKITTSMSPTKPFVIDEHILLMPLMLNS